jgi:CubicO group peptidase (beta-lactamase class C family)
MTTFPLKGNALWLFATLIALPGCSEEAVWPETGGPPAPSQLNDGWEVAAPESRGFDPRIMDLLDHDLRDRRIREVDALLIARDGVLVYESYPDASAGVDARHQLNSATKSVASTVVGAAAQQGLLEGYDQPISELFPEAADLFQADPRKNAITLRHVLTMTAGLAWDSKDVRSTDRDDIYINAAPDAVRYVLEKPMVHDPGTRFYYNSGCSMLLTGLVANVSGMEADAFAEEYLFGPLGIQDYRWQITGDGTPRGQDGLHLRGRDLLKLGQLYLQGGVWEGERILSQSWIDASFQPWTETDWETSRYGFQWWMYPYSPFGSASRPYGLVAASGYGGQKLFLVPELKLAVVFFGCTTEGYECGISDTVPEAVMYNYILPAITGGR